MPDVLLVSDDIVGARMAGPGIRAWEMARVLSGRFQTELAVPAFKAGEADTAFFDRAPFPIFTYAADRPQDLLARAEAARIIVIQGYVLSKFPALADLKRPIVADIYDPFVLENLFIHQKKIPNVRDREAVHFHDLGVFNGLLGRGDHFLVASDRQRDLITGSLLSLGRIGPTALDAGPCLDHLLSVVPFGIEESDESSLAPGPSDEFRALFPQIDDEDILLLWGGVLTDWYDPATLLRALKIARESHPRLKLLFLSTRHPNPVVPAMEAVPAARKLAAELSLGDAVIFNDGWIEYDRRGTVFRRADIGVSIHRTHFETRYAFRTRMLDYLKYGLPIIGTEGDVFADLVREQRLGRVVRSGDVQGLARAVSELAANVGERQEIRNRAAEIREKFLWKNTVAPLIGWIERVLAGDFTCLCRPSREDIIRACAGASKTASRGRLRIWAGKAACKLPPRLKGRLRRLWKRS